ncbi:hypothetical protein IV203_022353 [Nitzschia inconspicua]|uniref:Uncharacterized protein n=1 Tax=Nitzschia inconspicua TaxID=303405 RepID=A0A9K3KII7_9STRA|nr:hypothetical protein IV203_022353 [Nitzschia inconspicua]
MSIVASTTRHLYLKNVTFFWVGATALCIWFLFVHAPPFIVKRKIYKDVPLAAHLGGAYAIYLACLFNSLFTPSTLKYGKEVHTAIGRIGMVSGLVSFALGFYCAWLRPVTPPLSFSIGITVGGVAQIVSQLVGWKAIWNYQRLSLEERELLSQGYNEQNSDKLAELRVEKRKSLSTHIYNMIALYTIACGAPALIRIAGMVLPEEMSVPGLVGSVIFLNLIAKPFGGSYVRNIKKTD